MANNNQKPNLPAKKNTSKKTPERDEYAYYDDLYPSRPRKKKTDGYEDHYGDRPKKHRKNEPEPELPPPSTQTIHRFMPFILGIATIFVVACLMLASIEGAMGILGVILRNLFFGLFGWPAWIIPVILLNLIIYWRRYVDLGLTNRKIIFGCAVSVLLSSLIHSLAIGIIYKDGYGWGDWGASIFGFGKDVASNWTLGISLHGGGFIGGFFGGLFRCLAGYIGSVIIIIALLAVAVIFFFGLSPRHFTDMVISFCQKIKGVIVRIRDSRAQRREEYEEDEGDEEYEEDEDEPLTVSAPKRRSLPSGNKRKPVFEPEEDEEKDEPVIPLPAPQNKDYDPDAVEVIGSVETKYAEKPGKKTVDPIRSISLGESPEKFTTLVDSIFGDEVSQEQQAASSVLELTEAPVTDAPVSAEPEPPAEPEDDGVIPPEIAKKRREYEQLAAYIFPPLTLLHESSSPGRDAINAELRENAQTLIEKLESFKVKIAKVEYSRGPTLTRYELYPAPGVKANSITNLQTDIAMALRAKIRIEAPIPGKSAVGVEVPNKSSSTVAIRELLESDQFKNATSKLFCCLGKDITGEPIFIDIGKMPHLLIAGTTGSGKSVCINSIVMSLLYKARPDEVQLVMIDPKKVEMSMYNGLPHLRVPVVTNVKKAAGALAVAVQKMEERYELFESRGAREIDGYNRLLKMEDPDEPLLPRIVIIIDELADLMMTAPTEIENSIVRLAQKARAAGIHLIVGTQRPSVDVITGLIKANIPSRIAFAVASGIDSRTIIDSVGAEKLLGRGDMLFSPIGSQNPIRAQGTFVTDDEVIAVTNFVKENSGETHYDDEFLKQIDSESAQIVTVGQSGKKGASPAGGAGPSGTAGECFDEHFFEALRLAVESGTIATSFLQRNINVGFGRGARIIDRMAKLGFVTPPDGTKPRQVLLTQAQFNEMQARGDKRVYGLIPDDEPEEEN